MLPAASRVQFHLVTVLRLPERSCSPCCDEIWGGVPRRDLTLWRHLLIGNAAVNMFASYLYLNLYPLHSFSSGSEIHLSYSLGMSVLV